MRQMRKTNKVTIALSEIAEIQFADVQYGLDFGNGIATNSQVVNSMIEEVYLFEKIMDDPISNWLQTNYPEQYEALIKKTGLDKSMSK